ncbi:hypothetical protein JK175_01585 [Lacticaseibacillus paracasei]|uniref:phage tail assembly chaperone G n=1 Tax=Lacticaseibacillus paracasei TaxID=1597 RepID=UPI001BA841C2|nr:hypothetical protein [Lacticaseibacillus paracasei]MBS0990546.1 hypothetical protein [Lacticaseibacillus paracasei]
MLKLDLRNKDGKIEHFQETFVPVSKLIEGLKLTPQNFPDLDESDWMEKNAEFMASCFEDKSVTKKRILDGVAAWDFNKVFDTFNQQLFGIDPKKVAASESAEKKH